MKYLVIVLGVMLISSIGVSYWYYQDSQKTITTLTENNAKLETAVSLNEQTIDELEQSGEQLRQEISAVNQENILLRRRNTLLVEKFRNNDIGLLAEQKPELIENLINRGTDNALRCFELLSGAELNEQEITATTGEQFNNECPWLFDTLERP